MNSPGLKFVDDFNANQANSILTWAMKDPNNHILPGHPRCQQIFQKFIMMSAGPLMN